MRILMDIENLDWHEVTRLFPSLSSPLLSSPLLSSPLLVSVRTSVLPFLTIFQFVTFQLVIEFFSNFGSTLLQPARSAEMEPGQ